MGAEAPPAPPIPTHMIGEGFFPILGEQGQILFGFWVSVTRFIFVCNKGLYPEIIIFCLYSNKTGGDDLDLIDFHLHILTH